MGRLFTDTLALHTSGDTDANGDIMAVEGLAVIGVQVAGTFGATITFQGSIDGSNYVAIQGQNLNNGAVATSTTAAGLFGIPVAGLQFFRAPISSHSSGSVTVTALGIVGGAGVTLADIDVAGTETVAIATIASQTPDYDSDGQLHVDIDTIAAGSNVIGGVNTGQWIETFTLTLTTDSDAYAQNDVFAAPQEIASVGLANGAGVVLQSVCLFDADDNGRAIDLLFFDGDVSIGAENAAVGPADSDMVDHLLGVVSIGASDYTDLANSQEATLTNLGLGLECAAASTSIWVGAVYRDATGDTYTATGVTLKLSFLQGT